MQNLRELWVWGCKINILCGFRDYFVADNVDNQFDIIVERFFGAGWCLSMKI
jgi:hypothetical protein